MLADSLNWVADKLEASINGGADKTAAVIAVLKDLMLEHGNAVFGGDGYSEEWHKMAVEERGLKNLPTSADALPAFQDEAVIKLFSSTGVLSAVELESRYEVYSEQYIQSIQVEAKLMIDMAKTIIYPAASSYLMELSTTYSGMSEMGIELDKSVATSVATQSNALLASVAKLQAAMEKHDFDSVEAHMQYLANDVRGLMNEVRSHADALEAEVPDDMWPLAKYREMLFIK
jgi:glutamine synthetase